MNGQGHEMLPSLRPLLQQDGFVLSAWSSLTDPMVHEALLRSPFDALTLDMQLIPRWMKLDSALLPVGGNFTMDVDDAIVAADFCGASKVIGMHYDTFGFIKIDHEAAKAAFAKAGKELLLMNIGETLAL